MPTLRNYLLDVYAPERGLIDYRGDKGLGNVLARMGGPEGPRLGAGATDDMGGVELPMPSGFRSAQIGGGSGGGGQDPLVTAIGEAETGNYDALARYLGERGDRDAGITTPGDDPNLFPGRNTLLSVLGQFLPFPLGTVASTGNTLAGLAATNRQVGGYLSEVTGAPVTPTFGDYLAGMFGLPGVSARERGIGGYGNLGMGGITADLNYVDPGVAGPARALARQQVEREQRRQERDRSAGPDRGRSHGGGGNRADNIGSTSSGGWGGGGPR